MRKFLILVLVLFPVLLVQGQQRLLSIMDQQDLTLDQQVDSVIVEFGLDVKEQELSRLLGMLGRLGGKTRCVAVSYRTEDPKGGEVEASGLIVYPLRPILRGVVEMCPYNREKNLCGTARMYTTEALAATLGYVVLIPDNLGYGKTSHLPIPYQMSENSARVSADLRLAAEEYFEQTLKRKLPSKTILYGYSLGAPAALALAYLYTSHPEYGARVKTLCMGSGCYDPLQAFEQTLESGHINYMIYPSFVRSANAWMDACINVANVFRGRVLEDFDRIASGLENARKLVEEYGSDVRAYLHPDFYTLEGNPDIGRLKTALSALTIPHEEKNPLPSYVKVVIRHSVTDDIVPVACSDRLYRQISQGFRPVRYFREKSGTHYETAVRSFRDLAFLLL